MTGICLTCGWLTDYLEAHHVAGRHNHQELTVPVCTDCHQILTTWQLASGVELDENAPRTDADATRALLVGVMQLFQLYAQRHPESTPVSAALAIHTARAMSKLLDACEPADRPGRWLPDPTVPPTEAVPVAWPADTEAGQAVELAHLVAALATIAGEQSPLAAGLVVLAADPEQLRGAFEPTEPLHPGMTDLFASLARLMDDMHDLIRRLLVLEDPSWIDGDLIEEAAVWINTGRRLLDQALTLALTGISKDTDTNTEDLS